MEIQYKGKSYAPGDILWSIHDVKSPYPVECMIAEIRIRSENIDFLIHPLKSSLFMPIGVSWIGKTIFHSEAEAKAALEKKRNRFKK